MDYIRGVTPSDELGTVTVKLDSVLGSDVTATVASIALTLPRRRSPRKFQKCVGEARSEPSRRGIAARTGRVVKCPSRLWFTPLSRGGATLVRRFHSGFGFTPCTGGGGGLTAPCQSRF